MYLKKHYNMYLKSNLNISFRTCGLKNVAKRKRSHITSNRNYGHQLSTYNEQKYFRINIINIECCLQCVQKQANLRTFEKSSITTNPEEKQMTLDIKNKNNNATVSLDTNISSCFGEYEKLFTFKENTVANIRQNKKNKTTKNKLVRERLSNTTNTNEIVQLPLPEKEVNLDNSKSMLKLQENIKIIESSDAVSTSHGDVKCPTCESGRTEPDISINTELGTKDTLQKLIETIAKQLEQLVANSKENVKISLVVNLSINVENHNKSEIKMEVIEPLPSFKFQQTEKELSAVLEPPSTFEYQQTGKEITAVMNIQPNFDNQHTKKEVPAIMNPLPSEYQQREKHFSTTLEPISTVQYERGEKEVLMPRIKMLPITESTTISTPLDPAEYYYNVCVTHMEQPLFDSILLDNQINLIHIKCDLFNVFLAFLALYQKTCLVSSQMLNKWSISDPVQVYMLLTLFRTLNIRKILIREKSYYVLMNINALYQMIVQINYDKQHIIYSDFESEDVLLKKFMCEVIYWTKEHEYIFEQQTKKEPEEEYDLFSETTNMCSLTEDSFAFSKSTICLYATASTATSCIVGVGDKYVVMHLGMLGADKAVNTISFNNMEEQNIWLEKIFMKLPRANFNISIFKYDCLNESIFEKISLDRYVKGISPEFYSIFLKCLGHTVGCTFLSYLISIL